MASPLGIHCNIQTMLTLSQDSSQARIKHGWDTSEELFLLTLIPPTPVFVLGSPPAWPWLSQRSIKVWGSSYPVLLPCIYWSQTCIVVLRLFLPTWALSPHYLPWVFSIKKKKIKPFTVNSILVSTSQKIKLVKLFNDYWLTLQPKEGWTWLTCIQCKLVKSLAF